MNTKKALNIAAFALVLFGLVLKANYWAGGHAAIILACASMLVALIAFAMKDNTSAGMSDGWNRYLTVTLALLIAGSLLKLQRWTGASVVAVPAYVCAFALPLVLILRKRDFTVSKQYMITLFTFLVLLLGIVPRSPVAQFVGRGWERPIAEVWIGPPAPADPLTVNAK